MTDDLLPFVTPDLPGIGGALKCSPEDFIVEEVPLYEPADEGEHIYVRVRRRGMTTRELVERLCALLPIPEIDVGYAGMKDKQACTEQTVSLRIPGVDPAAIGRRIADGLPVEVPWARRHRNKLKKGHLLGNRFTLVVAATTPDAMARACAIRERLAVSGVPNYYGEQRFGGEGSNAARGRELLFNRGPRGHWIRNLLLSAWQSSLFNRWLAERIRGGTFTQLLAGDIAKKTDTGGMFPVVDPVVEQPRYDRGEITLTGPIYGAKMRAATEVAGEIEQRLFAQEGVTIDQLKRARLDGTRRAARLMGLTIDLVAAAPDALRFAFELPKGAYATVLLREFMKSAAPAGDAVAEPEDES